MLSHFSRVQFLANLWTVGHRAPLSTGFSRQEYWSGLPCPPPGSLPNPGIKPVSPAFQMDSLSVSHQGGPGKSYSDLVAKLCLTIWDPTVAHQAPHGISQASILERVAISFFKGSSQRLNPGLLHCRQILYQLSCIYT